MERSVTEKQVAAFQEALCCEECSTGTVEAYLREIRRFVGWLAGAPVTKERVVEWKDRLLAQSYYPATVNAKLAALRRFLRFMGWEECLVKNLRIQRRLFCDRSRQLSREEYRRLCETARRLGKQRLALLMEAICATGIRVSEVRYLTLESVRRERAEISLKGKVRTILIPRKLGQKLLKYAKKCGINSGEIFRTREGKPLSRKQIWAEMKQLCRRAEVEPTKVFPHNLRHLFARCFYRIHRDVAQLADLLGHSSVETTRIYLVSTGEEHARALAELRLIS